MIFPPTNKQFPSIPGNQFKKFAIHFLLTRFIFLSRRFLPIFTSCFTYIQNETGVVHNLVETKVRKELFCYVCPYSIHVWMLGKNTDIHLDERLWGNAGIRHTKWYHLSSENVGKIREILGYVTHLHTHSQYKQDKNKEEMRVTMMQKCMVCVCVWHRCLFSILVQRAKHRKTW